jgi:hypothetical protein
MQQEQTIDDETLKFDYVLEFNFYIRTDPIAGFFAHTFLYTTDGKFSFYTSAASPNMWDALSRAIYQFHLMMRKTKGKCLDVVDPPNTKER